MIVELNNDNFNSVALNNEKTVLIEFYTEWCPYCKKVYPFLLELLKKKSDIVIGRVNTDLYEDLAETYQIDIVPTFMVIKNKSIIDKKVIYNKLEELESFINK